MNKSEMANEISKTFKGEKIVIRSSSTNEDCLKNLMQAIIQVYWMWIHLILQI